MTRMQNRFVMLALAIPGVGLMVTGWSLVETGVLNSLFAFLLFFLGFPLLLIVAGIWIAGRNRESKQSKGLNLD